MGEEDIRRQALNVMRMEMLGAKVVDVYKRQSWDFTQSEEVWMKCATDQSA